MALDEAILTAHSEGRVPPTVRFYEWEPAALSIGYFQKAEEEVNFEALEREGIGFVRRPTGGRAVLHDRELTYSIIVSEEHEGIPSTVTEAYRVLSEGFCSGSDLWAWTPDGESCYGRGEGQVRIDGVGRVL